jgi:hypothetical protein
VSFFWFSEAASAQALIKVNDTINLKLGFLLQPKATGPRMPPLGGLRHSGRLPRVEGQ